VNVFRSERFHRLFKEGFWIVFGQAMAVLGSLVGVRLFTELLEPAAYGELAIGLTAATLINQTVLGPLGNGIIRFYAPAKERGDLGSYLAESRSLILRATGVVTVIMISVVGGLLIARQTDWIVIAIAALAFALLSGYNSILSGIQNAARQRAVVAFHQGLESWIRFICAATLMSWLGATSTIAITGYILALTAVLSSQYFFFRKTIPLSSNPRVDKKYWGLEIWKFSWPISLFGVFTWAQLASDRWSLGFFSTMQEVGLYAVLFQLGFYPIALANGMITQFLAPIFYQRAGDASDNQRNANVSNLSWQLTRLSLLATGVAFLATFLLHTQLFGLLVAKEYSRISYLLPWIILAGGIFSAGESMSLNLMSQMKTQYLIKAKIGTALMGIVFNVAGGYLSGSAGIVTANILFSAIYFTWMVILSKNQGIKKVM